MAEFSRQHFHITVSLDDRFVDGAWLAAEQAPRRAFDAVSVAAKKQFSSA
jgi:hypothetical protein